MTGKKSKGKGNGKSRSFAAFRMTSNGKRKGADLALL
jgi:hypothetical protein